MPTFKDLVTGGPRINPDRWGPWRLDPDEPYLEHTIHDYPIDLARLAADSAEMLDMIIQVTGKSWADDAAVAGLVRAFDDVLKPQQNLCSFGRNTPISKRAVTRLVAQARRNGAPLTTS